MLTIANAFSLNMLNVPPHGGATLKIQRLTLEEARALLKKGPYSSVVGHEETARLLTELLGVEVPVNRASYTLAPGEKLLVAQYKGPRLPEGATKLPEGATIEFYLVLLGLE